LQFFIKGLFILRFNVQGITISKYKFLISFKKKVVVEKRKIIFFIADSALYLRS